MWCQKRTTWLGSISWTLFLTISTIFAKDLNRVSKKNKTYYFPVARPSGLMSLDLNKAKYSSHGATSKE